MSDEIKLFETPDLAALTRNGPRIALRAGVLVLVPILTAILARETDLYAVIGSLPLPLDFLRAGPFAYEAKAIAAIVALFLGLAFLMPKRTTQLVIAVCVGGVLWTGHVFIQLQWARLFAAGFDFRRDASPTLAAWVVGATLLLVGVVYLVLEGLLDARARQEARGLDRAQARDALTTSARTLGAVLAVGLGIAAALVGAYLGLRALLADARLPFRVNPVFALLAMGVGLAVLVAVALRRRSPVEADAQP